MARMAFNEVSLGEFTKPHAVVATEQTSLREALNLIAQHQLLAIPVVKSSDGACLGLVTTFDIFNQMITFIHKEGMGRSEEEIEAAAPEHLNSSITVCFGISKESTRNHVFESLDRLEKVLPIFTKGIQRVVLTGKGESPRILSQLDILRFFSSHYNLSGEIDRSIEELGIYKGPSKVMVFFEDRPAITAFALMAIHRVRAIPVVNMEGKAWTQIGEADLRGLGQTNLKKVALNTTDFVKFRHPQGPPSPFCKKSSSLREVLNLMLTNGYHKVWVIDEQKRIAGGISILDIVTKFACHERRSGD